MKSGGRILNMTAHADRCDIELGERFVYWVSGASDDRCDDTIRNYYSLTCPRGIVAMWIRQIAYGSIGLFLCSMLAACGPSEGEQAYAEEAQEAATEWLALVDAGEYEASYSEAASFFQSQLTAEQWAQLVEQGQNQLDLGSFNGRTLIAARYTDSPPDQPHMSELSVQMPDEYVAVQYRADYGKTVIETVTLTQDNDAWRVIGYYIRPKDGWSGP